MLGTRGVPARYGGFETAVEEVGSRLAAAGHHVTVYCRPSPDDHLRTHLGMHRVVLPALHRRSLETLSHGLLSALHLVTRRTRPDAVLVLNAANAVVLPLLRARGLPVATHVDGLEWQRAKWSGAGQRFYRVAERLAVRWSDALVADAEGIAAYYAAEFGAMTEQIAYGAPVQEHPASHRLAEVGLEPGGYHLVVARFEPENHVDGLVRAHLASGAVLPLVVVGSAPYASEHVRAIEALARDGRVRLLGAVWDEELLDQLYAGAAVHLHGHSVGGTNPSLLRAMGAGAPVVAYDVVFNREVLGEHGVLFTTEAELGGYLREAEADPRTWRARGAALRERAGRCYRWDDVAAAYAAMLADLADGVSQRGDASGARASSGSPWVVPAAQVALARGEPIDPPRARVRVRGGPGGPGAHGTGHRAGGGAPGARRSGGLRRPRRSGGPRGDPGGRRLRPRGVGPVPRGPPEHPAPRPRGLRPPRGRRGHRRGGRRHQGPRAGGPAGRAPGDRRGAGHRRRGRRRRLHRRQGAHVGAAALRRAVQGRRLARHPQGRGARGVHGRRGCAGGVLPLHPRHVLDAAARDAHGQRGLPRLTQGQQRTVALSALRLGAGTMTSALLVQPGVSGPLGGAVLILAGALLGAGARRHRGAPGPRAERGLGPAPAYGQAVRAIQVTSTGGPEVLLPADLPDPRPGPGQLLVEVAAAGVNFIDVYRRDGTYPVALPDVPGSEGAGTVRALGAGADGFAVGDRVAWAAAPGSYARLAVVDARAALAVPEGVDDQSAAAVPLQGMTAHYLTASTFPVAAGQDVLVHAGAGGHRGAGGADGRRPRGQGPRHHLHRAEGGPGARGRGRARHPLRRDGRPRPRAARGRARDRTGRCPRGLRRGGGPRPSTPSMACLRRRGTLVLFGGSSGPVPPVDPQRLNAAGSLFLTRPTLVDHVAEPGELAWRAREVFAGVADGSLRVRVGHRYPLDQAAAAHADLQARATTGKLLLLPGA